MKIKTENYTSYLHDEDVTIVWQNLLITDDRGVTECAQHALIGWYSGEPDDDVTKDYCNMPTIAQYLDCFETPEDIKRRRTLQAARQVVKDYYTVNSDVLKPEENNRLLTLLNNIDDILR